MLQSGAWGMRGDSVDQFESLVRSCLYNWLGYGNPNGTVWFVGTEEGGAEIWRSATQTLEQSLLKRSAFTLTMDFREVWEDQYRIPLESFKGPNVWRYMAALLLALKEVEPNTNNTGDFVFGAKKLGTLESDHFMCELLPLPKRKKDLMDGYHSTWAKVGDYHHEVLPKRFELIRDTLVNNPNVQLLVSYERLLTGQVLSHFSSDLLDEWAHAHEQYSLYKVDVADNRGVYMLATPFFGNGRISYGGLEMAAKKVRQRIEIPVG